MTEQYLLGPDPEGDFANKTRIADAAQEIVEGLRAYLKRGDEPLNRLLKNCSSYERGLTNGEALMAVQVALSIYQIELVNELAMMHFEEEEDAE